MLFDNDEKDDFWDVEKLLPKKKPAPIPNFSSREKTVAITVPGDVQSAPRETKLTIPQNQSSQDESIIYSYEKSLIKSVKINKIGDKYDFYGNFRKAALLYYDFKTAKCELAPFFSYMPQYSQFNTAQKNFYFFWRDCVRRKKYIDTDYSYLYLYVYEILNLPDKISADEGLSLLVAIWRAYRDRLPNIDANMALWIQDYCLVYNLRAPMEQIRDFIFDVIGAAEFKEFYLSDISAMGVDGIIAMIAYLSDYDWRKSKYADVENREAYTKHLTGAMGVLINELSRSGRLVGSSTDPAVLKRSAFKNSLCTHSVKCNLEIEYIPLSKADDLRAAVTAALKYTENKLRALLGVKSRLAIKGLPDDYRELIDAYFVSVFAEAQRERARASMPEYERLYDKTDETLSSEGADEIERASWSTTARLVEETELSEETDTQSVAETTDLQKENASKDREQTALADTYGLSEPHIEFIRLTLGEEYCQAKELAECAGMLTDAMADEINEAFADGFGDVILEGEDGEYKIIEDYLEDVEQWLRKLTK